MLTAIIILLTIALYFGALFAVTGIASRRRAASDFFTGGRSAPWWAAMIATVGAAISGVTFISVPGMVEAQSFSYLQMVLGFAVGFVVIALVLVPLFYSRNLTSIYGYLAERFGATSHRSGAWIFFISKMLGASVRFFVVCAVLQPLVFDPLGIPFVANVAVTIALIWLYTNQGGVTAVVWTDVLKTLCLVTSVVLCTVFIGRSVGMNIAQMASAVADAPTSRIFFFDNPTEPTFFWKQFLAGIFMVIATTGLDQDMMQRTMACRSTADATKNMVVSGIVQIAVVGLFLVMGAVLLIYSQAKGVKAAKPDELFGLVAWSDGMPIVVGVMFILGLISAAYSAAGSALTSLTTSFTVDILRRDATAEATTRIRRLTHIAMAALMGLVIIVFYYISDDSAITAVYKIASYTYGPILGLFAFGILSRRPVRDRLVPWVCLAAPCLSWLLQWWLLSKLGYAIGFELLLVNAALTMLGLLFISKKYNGK